MATITNKSKTVRNFNSKDFNGNPVQIDVAPGQSVEGEIADPWNPVYHGWQDVGDVDFGGALTRPGPHQGMMQEKIGEMT